MGCRELQLNDCFRIIRPTEDTYAYDAPGGWKYIKTNKAKSNYTFNYNDQLISESSTTKGETAYTYDANGSMTGKVSDAGDSYIYTYNLQNRLQTASITRTETGPMGGGSKLVDITSAYVYNLSGIRVGANTSTKIDGGAADVKNTVYLTDPANFTGYSQVLEETVNGTLAKTYSIAQEIIAQSSGGTVNYLMRDGHNNTRLLTDNSSNITDRYYFDAYGKEMGTKFGAVNTPTTNMLYAGEQYDVGLLNYYNRARYYNPSNGTWNRLDPFNGNMGDPQSLHKYSYCHQNPVMGMDPSGKFTLVEMLVVVGIIAITASLFYPALNKRKQKKSLKLGISLWADVRIRICWDEKDEEKCKKFTNFVEFLDFLRSTPHTIKSLAIKSHGAPDTMRFGAQGNLSAVEGTIMYEDSEGNNNDITDLFVQRLSYAEISLNGCRTGYGANSIAQRISAIIPHSIVDGGAAIGGQIGVPFVADTIGTKNVFIDGKKVAWALN